jgi:two-component system nitrate/nitrite response regulator NarL
MIMRGARQSISLVVADDHPVVLHGIVGILRAHPGLRVLASCPDGGKAAEAIRQHRPDIAVLDLAMPGLNGLELLASISSNNLHSKIVFLTAIATDRQILAAVEGGAMGLLFKDYAADQLISCIRAIAAGERWLPAELVEPARRREEARQARSDLRLLSTR